VASGRFRRATDLGHGCVLYPVIGIGGPLLVWAAFAAAVVMGGSPAVLVWLGAASSGELGLLIVTRFAAPTMLQIGGTADREKELWPLLDRFSRLNVVRLVCAVVALISLVAALVART